MARLSKRVKAIREGLDRTKLYPVTEAMELLKTRATAKFNESVDVAINLGIDPKKSDQAVRGSSVLPKGTGKTVRVAVLCKGDQAEEAKQAGADLVGFDDLADKIQGGLMDFDVLIATPDAMPVVSKLGKILGPRGLMPNPKVGTVTKDVKLAVTNAKAGQVQFRTDKNGIIHCAIGKASFDKSALLENLQVLLNDLIKAKPSSAKGVYIKKISLSTTMGPGVTVDQSTLTIG
ncbi:MAG: 50S ribosomal protein L1 [Gammaproteobacteria bacterium RIFCSPLOWO2_12_FULL_52_10]|nr:MAG: 50S ribosomal protein L1 [Gammaproteobacteria bacterium RIFCSPLOWO2_12_FULL_52_10]